MPRWPHVGPRWPHVGPRWQHVGPEWSQAGLRNASHCINMIPCCPKIAPCWPKMAPSWPQDSFWNGPYWPKWPHTFFKRSQFGPRCSNVGSRRPLDDFMFAQDGPEMVPRCPLPRPPASPCCFCACAHEFSLCSVIA